MVQGGTTPTYDIEIADGVSNVFLLTAVSSSRILNNGANVLLQSAGMVNGLTFTNRANFKSAVPLTQWEETDQASDGKKWQLLVESKTLIWRTINDNESGSSPVPVVFFQVNRGSTTAVSSVQIPSPLCIGSLPGASATSVGVVNDAGGFKHMRLSTGSIAASSSADVTVTWTTSFADANYTIQAVVVESTGGLQVVTVKSQSATQAVVKVTNNTGGSLTGTLNVIAIHD